MNGWIALRGAYVGGGARDTVSADGMDRTAGRARWRLSRAADHRMLQRSDPLEKGRECSSRRILPAKMHADQADVGSRAAIAGLNY